MGICNPASEDMCFASCMQRIPCTLEQVLLACLLLLCCYDTVLCTGSHLTTQAGSENRGCVSLYGTSPCVSACETVLGLCSAGKWTPQGGRAGKQSWCKTSGCTFPGRSSQAAFCTAMHSKEIKVFCMLGPNDSEETEACSFDCCPCIWNEGTKSEGGTLPVIVQVYREDLVQYPDNGWSLHGLSAALHAQGVHAGVDAIRHKLEAAWAHAQDNVDSSCLAFSRSWGEPR